jgi:SOS-response transcriptional repressor LexA
VPIEDNVYQMEQLLDLEGIPPYFGNILEEAANKPSSAIVNTFLIVLKKKKLKYWDLLFPIRNATVTKFAVA